MKRKAIIPLVLGLGVGLFTVKLAVDTIRKAQASNRNKPDVKVVRAKQDIHARQIITPEMVELVETSDNAFAPEVERIDKLEDVVGRVTSKAIPQFSPILVSMLSPKGTREGMVGRIPPGFRAVSVKIDEVAAVSYQMRPGDWVDVLVVMDVDSGVWGRKETIAEVILQRVQVAAIGYAQNADTASSTSKTRPAKSATLFVREEDAPKLHLAQTRGKITLSMRGEDESTLAQAPQARLGDLLGGLGFPKPVVKQPAPKAPTQKQPKWTPPEPEIPYTVVIAQHSAVPGGATSYQQIMFESQNSTNILEYREGPPTRASSRFRSSNRKPTSGKGSGGSTKG